MLSCGLKLDLQVDSAMLWNVPVAFPNIVVFIFIDWKRATCIGYLHARIFHPVAQLGSKM